MPQKILAGRSDDPLLQNDLTRVKVDQVILARDPSRTINEALARGLRKAAVETAVAYETHCVARKGEDATSRVPDSIVQQGVLLSRAGIGFPAAVHLERFGSPARLAVTDEPRMAATGGVGMLTLVVSPSQLADAMLAGSLRVRPPRSVQVLLSGRIRPFVCVRDVALELLRRGIGEIIERIDREHGAPVVVEFAGPSARLISVPDRAVLCALAPQLGAAGAVFVSDEKTEVYLRDQRRSKAHRALSPDAGAPCDDVLTVDLSAVDPLVLDVDGKVKPVRELKGKPVRQVILGGDCGASLRDILAAAALLKSKRVPPKLDLLLVPPSRQVLEVLAKAGALVDLIATGARLLEPDHRVLTGELYPPPSEGVSLRTFDPEPGSEGRFVVGSAETLAYAVAYGEVGDPRSFKRPVRVTVPRALPTDDVLVVRKTKGKAKAMEDDPSKHHFPAAVPWSGETRLQVVNTAASVESPSAFVLSDPSDVNWLARSAPILAPALRAVVAPYVPSALVPLLSGLGVLALSADSETVSRLAQQAELVLPAPESWDGEKTLHAKAGDQQFELTWLALDAERNWTKLGTAGEAGPQKARKTAPA
ncbi:MAG: 3-isopropylmalate dehydratase [Myxococcales bacterium]|nr:3-isopropylmalate dehydratase [Myxococcales bacterium]